MKKKDTNTEEILSRQISGFHTYCLAEPVRLAYASQNLCELLGCAPEALQAEDTDPYARYVHPADRERYEAFLRRLREETAASLTDRYRIVTETGRVLHVSDTFTTRRLDDGSLMGYSVLSDITEVQEEIRDLRFLNDTIPCGFLKYTCENAPRITYINDRMLRFLRFPEKAEMGFDALEMYKQNIYMMIPMEDRRRFALYLRLVSRRGGPIAGEMTVLRCDGTRARLYGWVTKCVNEQGEEEFQSACMDITDRHALRQGREMGRYLRALTEVYEHILEYDLSARTVKAVHSQATPIFRWIENLPLQMEEATESWITSAVLPQDQEKVRLFFEDLYRKNAAEGDSPPSLRFRAFSAEGKAHLYTGLFINVKESVYLFCCRSSPDAEGAEALRDENLSLRDINESMQRLVMQFTDGLAAFKVVDDTVTPLYASENVCDFFGITRDEWIAYTQKHTPIREFVARSNTAYADFLELLETGEAEFAYFDHRRECMRTVKAVCSPSTPEDSRARYVILYHVDEKTPQREKPLVEIRTFGYFDVFVDDKPIAFRNEKSKELLALLVDRRGGFISSEEAIGFLWEDEPASPVTLARYRKVALRLKNTLEEYGIPDIVESVSGQRRLVMNKVTCDLYEYLSGREEYAQLFKGSYLTNYSWGENTLAELLGEHMF